MASVDKSVGPGSRAVLAPEDGVDGIGRPSGLFAQPATKNQRRMSSGNRTVGRQGVAHPAPLRREAPRRAPARSPGAWRGGGTDSIDAARPATDCEPGIRAAGRRIPCRRWGCRQADPARRGPSRQWATVGRAGTNQPSVPVAGTPPYPQRGAFQPCFTAAVKLLLQASERNQFGRGFRGLGRSDRQSSCCGRRSRPQSSCCVQQSESQLPCQGCRHDSPASTTLSRPMRFAVGREDLGEPGGVVFRCSRQRRRGSPLPLGLGRQPIRRTRLAAEPRHVGLRLVPAHALHGMVSGLRKAGVAPEAGPSVLVRGSTP